jgi:demethylmenaquinone methyltransferase / 2-methoxy-6-polyprenyl-1,4-benzoquinol methylase
MTNKFYSPDDQRAVRVRELFGRIAPRYDLMNHLQSFGLHLRWKRMLVELAGVQPHERALDLCCGTGDIALTLCQRGARVVGLDFTRQMLEVAAARKRKEALKSIRAAGQFSGNLPHLHFLAGDAQSIPFPDDTFDIVTIGYGLRNLANWETGLREMQRVVRPGGRLLILEFGKPDNSLWRGIYFGYLRLFVPLLGLLFCGSAAAYSYILESLKHFPAQRGIAQKMNDLGLRNIKTLHPLGGVMGINYGEKAAGK